MLILTERLSGAGDHQAVLTLAYELREKSRLRATLDSGEEAALFMPGGTVLRDGDRLRSEDGRIVKVVAAPERVYRIECHDAADLARCAYHLGNRHTPIQVQGEAEDGHLVLRIRADAVLKDMLEGLGAHVIDETAPFEPEAGAYGGGHHHHEHESHQHAPLHAPKIHRARPNG
jgi:urease accessory protein